VDEDLTTSKRSRLCTLTQFDIIIETPLHLLDCRVNTQFNTLPTYSSSSPATVSVSTQCSVHGGRHIGNDSRIGTSAGGAGLSAPVRPASTIPAVAALVASLPTTERRGSEVSPARPDEGDTLLERNIVYDRLVSGQESEAGESPPNYVEALSARHGSRSRSRQPSGSRSRSRLGDAGSSDSLVI
jgi:arrestin-related trafficking adapter 3/6